MIAAVTTRHSGLGSFVRRTSPRSQRVDGEDLPAPGSMPITHRTGRPRLRSAVTSRSRYAPEPAIGSSAAREFAHLVKLLGGQATGSLLASRQHARALSSAAASLSMRTLSEADRARAHRGNDIRSETLRRGVRAPHEPARPANEPCVRSKLQSCLGQGVMPAIPTSAPVRPPMHRKRSHHQRDRHNVDAARKRAAPADARGLGLCNDHRDTRVTPAQLCVRASPPLRRRAVRKRTCPRPYAHGAGTTTR